MDALCIYLRIKRIQMALNRAGVMSRALHSVVSRPCIDIDYQNTLKNL